MYPQDDAEIAAQTSRPLTQAEIEAMDRAWAQHIQVKKGGGWFTLP